MKCHFETRKNGFTMNIFCQLYKTLLDNAKTSHQDFLEILKGPISRKICKSCFFGTKHILNIFAYTSVPFLSRNRVISRLLYGTSLVHMLSLDTMPNCTPLGMCRDKKNSCRIVTSDKYVYLYDISYLCYNIIEKNQNR